MLSKLAAARSADTFRCCSATATRPLASTQLRPTQRTISRRSSSAELPRRVDAVVASISLHHVADPAFVIDRIAGILSPRGTVVVIEWRWEEFSAQTAEWCFSRLESDGEEGWLHRHLAEWRASGQNWPSYLHDWAEREGLHRGDVLIRLLDKRLERKLLTYGPYFWPDLADTTEADERRAINAGQIQATRIHWVGILR
jgi:SAM-dependent methyltransferase